MNDEDRPEERPAGNLSRRNRSSEVGAFSLAELDYLIDVRERLVVAIDELEAGDAGIDSCRALLEGLLEDFDLAVADRAGQ